MALLLHDSLFSCWALLGAMQHTPHVSNVQLLEIHHHIDLMLIELHMATLFMINVHLIMKGSDLPFH